jgi:hypothetical protein
MRSEMALEDETSSEEGLVCPYCGDCNEDAWDFAKPDEMERVTMCYACNREFTAMAYATITYIGTPIAPPPDLSHIAGKPPAAGRMVP